jgi:nuclear-control-of-ATPase protein 2
MSRLFAQQMQSPAYNMARGPLLQLLLIQTQYMRRELLLQMGAMDTLMAQNYLTATISAMLPGAMALAVLVAALRRLVRRLRSRRRSRASLLKQVRSVLRDAERLLLRSLAGGCERLSQVDLGLLVISLHAMRQTVLRHRVLLSVGERHHLFEDCTDLESDVYNVSQKLLILQRMYRTQPALLAAGPPGRTRHDELGSGMQAVGESLARGSSRNPPGYAPMRQHAYGIEPAPARQYGYVHPPPTPGVAGGGGGGWAIGGGVEDGGQRRGAGSVQFAPGLGHEL